MNKNVKTVCVFCGSNNGRNPKFLESAKDLGLLLGQRGLRLVYGGGKVGLMGAVADACLEVGGEVIGVIPKALQQLEVAHTRLSELRVVDSMHERKALMEQLSDIVVALPGGFGTLDELNEIITWRQLGFHQMPIFILNIEGYYDQFLEFLSRSVSDGFIAKDHLDFLIICDSIADFNQKLKD